MPLFFISAKWFRSVVWISLQPESMNVDRMIESIYGMPRPAFKEAAFSTIGRSTGMTRADLSMLSTSSLPLSGCPNRKEMYSNSPSVNMEITGNVSLSAKVTQNSTGFESPFINPTKKPVSIPTIDLSHGHAAIQRLLQQTLPIYPGSAQI